MDDPKQKTVTVKYVIEDDSLTPYYATQGSSGCDLRAAEDATVPSRGWCLVSTGLRIELPEGYEAQVRPRSGLAAKHGITVLNSPGTIDSDYNGVIKVILLNTGDTDYSVKTGDRIAQLIFAEVVRASFLKQDRLTETLRGEGGFGSTGTR